ncbi:hypothetical protein FNV43_RR01091 [Rhamnella rubrinervis]|uniref:S-protein homolog n=1 Tax=Rhamnella rubrinervis TaxID=2594499 RepID=A0A8K0MRR3_9ROSA|nr:hypothetical protein FNV43_RR01091 [Rhamnella rubrinervis]
MKLITLLLFLFTLEVIHAGWFGQDLTRHVSITNALDPGVVLTIHCKSKDDDLGQHQLPYNSSFSWKFKSNAILRNTLFYCYIWWDGGYGAFDIYKATRDDPRCASQLASLQNLFAALRRRHWERQKIEKQNKIGSRERTRPLMEIQIRTSEMDALAAGGTASHSLYKGGLTDPQDVILYHRVN